MLLGAYMCWSLSLCDRRSCLYCFQCLLLANVNTHLHIIGPVTTQPLPISGKNNWKQQGKQQSNIMKYSHTSFNHSLTTGNMQMVGFHEKPGFQKWLCKILLSFIIQISRLCLQSWSQHNETYYICWEEDAFISFGSLNVQPNIYFNTSIMKIFTVGQCKLKLLRWNNQFNTRPARPRYYKTFNEHIDLF